MNGTYRMAPENALNACDDLLALLAKKQVDELGEVGIKAKESIVALQALLAQVPASQAQEILQGQIKKLEPLIDRTRPNQKALVALEIKRAELAGVKSYEHLTVLQIFLEKLYDSKILEELHNAICRSLRGQIELLEQRNAELEKQALLEEQCEVAKEHGVPVSWVEMKRLEDGQIEWIVHFSDPK